MQQDRGRTPLARYRYITKYVLPFDVLGSRTYGLKVGQSWIQRADRRPAHGAFECRQGADYADAQTRCKDKKDPL